MTTRYKLVVGTSLVAPLLVFGVAAAETTTTQQPTTSTTTTTQQTTLTAEQKQELQSRLSDRVAKLKTKLTTAEQARIKARCKNAQTTIGALNTRVTAADTKRVEAYGATVARVSQLSTRLKNQGVNIDALQTQITALMAKMQTYNTDMAAYKQAIGDLAAMDCAADPAAFKASLDSARSALTTVQQDVAAVKAAIAQNIKPELQKLKDQLDKGGN